MAENSHTQARPVKGGGTRQNLKHFREKHAYYYAFVAMLFGTGARPSEIIALRWGDVDLRTGIVSISKSRYMDTDNPTKTVASERQISLGEPIVGIFRALKPLHVAERDFVFRNQEGNPITEDKWPGKYWYRALRVCEIRPRKSYATRHTFISHALSRGFNIKWVAEYCATSVQMIEKHCGKYITSSRLGFGPTRGFSTAQSHQIFQKKHAR